MAVGAVLATMAVEETKFDLQVVHDNFLTSLKEDDDVLLKYYLDSYHELNKYVFKKSYLYALQFSTLLDFSP